MGYEIYFKETSLDDLKKIDKKQASRILLAITERLTKFPDQHELLKHKFKGYRKFRVGDFRVIFSIEGNKVIIYRIGHRREVYE